jgi:hypothetical protein
LGWTLAGRAGQTYYLPPLSFEESISLLSSFSKEAFDENRVAIEKLLPELGGLPLALTIMGEYIASEWNLGLGETLTEKLEDIQSLLTAKISLDGLASPRDRGIALKERFLSMLDSEHLNHYSQLVTVLPSDQLSEIIMTSEELAKHWDSYNIQDTIRELVDAGILFTVGRGQFAIHPLWQHILR